MMSFVHVASIDYDECLRPQKLKCLDDYVTANELLLTFIRESQAQATQKIVSTASIRQTVDFDLRTDGTGSAFVATQHIAKYLQATFDSSTLSDIILEKEAGHTVTSVLDAYHQAGFQNGIISNFNDAKKVLSVGKTRDLYINVLSRKFFDKDKILLLYTQLHKVAAEHPQEQIIFDFFDDQKPILETVLRFFSTHPTLIPSNVTFRPFLYCGQCDVLPTLQLVTKDGFLDGKPAPEYGIRGHGSIDCNYRQTAKWMTEIAIEHEGQYIQDGYRMSAYITPERLAEKRLGKVSAPVATNSNQTFFDSNIATTARDKKAQSETDHGQRFIANT